MICYKLVEIEPVVLDKKIFNKRLMDHNAYLSRLQAGAIYDYTSTLNKRKLISPFWEKDDSLFFKTDWIPFTQQWCVQRLVEICPVVLEKNFKSSMYFHFVAIISHWKKDVALCFNKLESTLFKLCWNWPCEFAGENLKNFQWIFTMKLLSLLKWGPQWLGPGAKLSSKIWWLTNRLLLLPFLWCIWLGSTRSVPKTKCLCTIFSIIAIIKKQD